MRLRAEDWELRGSGGNYDTPTRNPQSIIQNADVKREGKRADEVAFLAGLTIVQKKVPKGIDFWNIISYN